MVRISDARMSGTSYGACVLHVAPEAFIGGPLALVQTGTSSSSTCPAVVSACGCQRRRWRADAPHGNRARFRIHVGSAGSMRIT